MAHTANETFRENVIGHSGGGSLPSLTPAKRIYVFKNGDSFFAGKTVLVSSKYSRTWDSFLEQLNQNVVLATGAVQRIHTPSRGRIVKDLTQLENGAAYVVAGPERFQPINYEEVRIRNSSPPRIRKKEAQREFKEVKPVIHSKIQAEPKVTHFEPPKSLWFYRNGDVHSKPLLILFRRIELQSWDRFLRTVSAKIVLRNNAPIRRIFKLNGEEVVHVDHFQNNQFYVAVGQEKFLPVSYGHMPPSMVITSPRNNAFDVNFLWNQTPSNQENLADDSVKSKAVYEASLSYRIPHRKPPKKLAPVDYDQDSSGVFRAKRPHEETRGARPVHDEDLLIPLRSPSPQAVDEELLYEPAAGQRRNNPPHRDSENRNFKPNQNDKRNTKLDQSNEKRNLKVNQQREEKRGSKTLLNQVDKRGLETRQEKQGTETRQEKQISEPYQEKRELASSSVNKYAHNEVNDGRYEQQHDETINRDEQDRQDEHSEKQQREGFPDDENAGGHEEQHEDSHDGQTTHHYEEQHDDTQNGTTDRHEELHEDSQDGQAEDLHQEPGDSHEHEQYGDHLE